MAILNLNVGLLGHVDSGKTSLAKVLSQVSSTAAFDKDPQSQERGITLDLGFSSFMTDLPSHVDNSSYDKVQFTLVDCPGHASLIKTIIGGAHIIDLMVLVIDAAKGVQTQTSECLIIGEITKKKLIVVINKVDVLEDKKQLEKLLKKMRLTIDSTAFKGSPIVTASALNNHVKELVDALQKAVFLPDRSADKPFLFAVDHCFGIKGKGTVMTGTVLQGSVKINDEVEIPSINLVKKVKSIQMFKQPVNSAMQGDRVGICVTQFDPKLLERGIANQTGYVKKIYAAIMDFNKVKYYKNKIESKSSFHINVGYENIIANLLLFGVNCDSSDKGNSKEFDMNREYQYINEIDETTALNDMKVYVLLEFLKPILVPSQSLVIGARLDAPVYSNSCRLAFYGSIIHGIDVKNYQTEYLKNLKVYKEKFKKGIIDRISSDYVVIGKNMFKKETNIQKFVGMKVSFSTGEEGVIEGAFGQSGKFKIQVPAGVKESTKETLSSKTKNEDNRSKVVEISLHHRRYLFDSSKRLVQI
ncbi:UNVERIFIED_CONTAM: hypothetical protein PYX00_000483 [Menopon gallinae]|uniref:Tr-type G domain-containing protein n=1 Tax=Menopon gallinae TaxID=328185 RepID=A0AAW2I965_9NEOP